MLTDNQAAVLRYVETFRAEHQMPPTRAEISEAFGWSSPNAANEVLLALQKKGRISLRPGLSRGIFVLNSEPV